MPLYPGGPKLRLGLWNSIPATIVEVPMYLAGLWVYMRHSARDRAGRYGFGFLAAALLVLARQPDRPAAAVRHGAVVAAIAGSVVIRGALWADRHRDPSSRSGHGSTKTPAGAAGIHDAGTSTRERSSSPTDETPSSFITRRTSARRISIARATPAVPAAPRPYA